MAKTRIEWNAWGPAAFEEARASRKPVFLLLTAFWCEDGDQPSASICGESPAGALIRENFVPVLADADQNPEVALRYGLRSYPACAVLGADGALMGVFSLGELHDRREALAGLAAALSQTLAPAASLGLYRVPYIPRGDVNLERGLEAVERIRRIVEEALDRGMPDPRTFSGLHAISPLRFLLHFANNTGERTVLQRAVSGLHALCHSSLYDAVEGGFFVGDAPDGSQSYKLLRANADWLILALRVSREPEGAFALPLARGILHYLQHRLCTLDGAFAAGQRADGAYFRLTSEERRRVSSPAVEESVYAAPNALAVRAFCKGWRLLGERAYLDLALRTHGFIQSHLMAPDGTLAHVHVGAPAGLGYLDDVIELGHAQMALYHATLETRHLEGLRQTVRRLVSEHLNPAGGGFLDTRLEDRPSRMPFSPVVDFHLNARAAGFLVLAAAQLGDESLGVMARSVLSLLLAAGETDLEGACLLGSALLAALYPIAIFEAVTDGSPGQRLQVLDRLREGGAGNSLVTHRLAARGEEMQRLPRIVAHCGHQRNELPVGVGGPVGGGGEGG